MSLHKKAAWSRFRTITLAVGFCVSQFSGFAFAKADGLLREAQILLEKHKVHAAIACLNKLISAEPRNVAAYSERSFAYFQNGQYDESRSDASMAIKLAPNFAEAYVHRAAVFRETDRFQEALADSNRAIALNRSLAEAYAVRALVNESLEDFKKEVEDCNKAIELAPKVFRYYCIRAAALRRLKQYDAALRDCNLALGLTVEKTLPLLERGFTYSSLGQSQRAIGDFTSVTKSTSQLFGDYLLRAAAFQELGELQLQISQLTLALKISPSNAGLYQQRAYLYYKLGKLQDAIDDCFSAAKLDPRFTYSDLIAAAAFEELGLYEKAISLRTSVLNRDPEDALSLRARARDYEVLGRADLAKADWLKAIRLSNSGNLASMVLCSPFVDFKSISSGGTKRRLFEQNKDRQILLKYHYDHEGHICVPAQVNGRLLELMVDTGCAHSELWKRFAPEMVSTETAKLKGTTANGTEYKSGVFSAGSLTLGSLTMPNIALNVNEGLSDSKTLCGLLGGNILENFVVTIDYANSQVLLRSAWKPDGNKKLIKVPMTMVRDHRPYCAIKFDGQLEFMALLDTGSPHCMAADALVRPLLSDGVSYNKSITGPWLGRVSYATVTLKSIEMGKTNFLMQPIAVFPAAEAPHASSEVIIGNSFLRNFKTVTFDYPCRQIYFEPR